MPEVFKTADTAATVWSWGYIALRLVAALILGRVVAQVYSWTRLPNERTPSFPPTLVLLSVLIAMVTMVIGDSAARAFSLVGALSIVRFRTVVRDTQDTAFVIFAVVVGMAVGTENWRVALAGIGVVGIAAFWMMPRRLNGSVDAGQYILRVRLGLGHDVNALVGAVLDAQNIDRRLVSIGTAKQGMALEAAYEIRLRKGASGPELVKALNRVEGIQSVELTAADGPAEPI